jgi:hypothetical protein
MGATNPCAALSAQNMLKPSLMTTLLTHVPMLQPSKRHLSLTLKEGVQVPTLESFPMRLHAT